MCLGHQILTRILNTSPCISCVAHDWHAAHFFSLPALLVAAWAHLLDWQYYNVHGVMGIIIIAMLNAFIAMLSAKIYNLSNIL